MKRRVPYQYCIARYSPSVIRGEAINIGVALHDLETGEVQIRFDSDLRRLTQIDPGLDLHALRVVISVIEHGVAQKHREKGFMLSLPEHANGMIVFSEVSGGLSDSPSSVLSQLYQKFVAVRPKRIRRQSVTHEQIRKMVTGDLLKSEDPILRSMRPTTIDEGMGLQFDFGTHLSSGRHILIQSLSLDQGDKISRLADATRLVGRVSVARSLANLSNAKFIALIQPPINSDATGASEAQKIIDTALTSVKLDRQGLYLNDVALAVRA